MDAEELKKQIPKDDYYYLLRIIYYEIPKVCLKRKDKKIIKLEEIEYIQKWIDMNTQEKRIFINRILFGYWDTYLRDDYKTFWDYKDYISEEAQDEKKDEEKFSRNTYTNSSGSNWWDNFSSYYGNIFGNKDAYQILGISVGADKDQIKSAYRKLAKKYHPDMGGNQEMFIKIKNAYDILTEEVKPFAYN